MVWDTKPPKVLQLSLVLLHARRCSKGEQSTGALHFAVAFVAAVARVHQKIKSIRYKIDISRLARRDWSLGAQSKAGINKVTVAVVSKIWINIK